MVSQRRRSNTTRHCCLYMRNTRVLREQIRNDVHRYGADILAHHRMLQERKFVQHGRVSTYAHSIRVACLSLWLAHHLRVLHMINRRSLVRAALLHDYFLYDWHHWDYGTHRLHGFTHGKTALMNAVRDFSLTRREADAIAHHMTPMTLPPRTLEGALVSLADKISALGETILY